MVLHVSRRIKHDRGDHASEASWSRPKVDQELLARDVLIADLHEQIVETKGRLAKRRAGCAKESKKEAKKQAELVARLKELAVQNR